MTTEMYVNGNYREKNPDWHAVDAEWKADRIIEILTNNAVRFSTCVEVGCGSGMVVQHLANKTSGGTFHGYDISPDAACLWRESENVAFHHADFLQNKDAFDLLLMIDVFEHVEDYMGFLRKLSTRADWFVFHIPLEMHVSALLRDRHLHARTQVGHLHYFSKSTALATLEDTGYRIVHAGLTKSALETKEPQRSITRYSNIFRRTLGVFSPDLAVKILGGYSLLVLCKGAR